MLSMEAVVVAMRSKVMATLAASCQESIFAARGRYLTLADELSKLPKKRVPREFFDTLSGWSGPVPYAEHLRRVGLAETDGVLYWLLFEAAPKSAFDFERIYVLYPRKLGKSKGIDRCQKVIKTQADYEALEKAVRNYAQHCKRNRTEEQFIKHFPTFMSEWRDWVPKENDGLDAILPGRDPGANPQARAAQQAPGLPEAPRPEIDPDKVRRLAEEARKRILGG